jgi:hypothetical protein
MIPKVEDGNNFGVSVQEVNTEKLIFRILIYFIN